MPNALEHSKSKIPFCLTQWTRI